MTTITPELRQAIAAAGDRPLRIEDPETHAIYVLVTEERFHRLELDAAHAAGPLTIDEQRAALAHAGRRAGWDDQAGQADLEDAADVQLTYPAIDEAFREGWDTPEMAEYDDYEAHR